MAPEARSEMAFETEHLRLAVGGDGHGVEFTDKSTGTDHSVLSPRTPIAAVTKGGRTWSATEAVLRDGCLHIGFGRSDVAVSLRVEECPNYLVFEVASVSRDGADEIVESENRLLHGKPMWHTWIHKELATRASPCRCVTELIDHIIKESKAVYKGTDRESDFLIFHDALSQLYKDQGAQDYLKKEYPEFVGRWVGAVGTTNAGTVYANRPTGDGPELCRGLDSHGASQIWSTRCRSRAAWRRCIPWTAHGASAGTRETRTNVLASWSRCGCR